eukprot:7094081-Pyramimonas_sp.AAC.1
MRRPLLSRSTMCCDVIGAPHALLLARAYPHIDRAEVVIILALLFAGAWEENGASSSSVHLMGPAR